jgi:hypothetical protein
MKDSGKKKSHAETIVISNSWLNSSAFTHNASYDDTAFPVSFYYFPLPVVIIMGRYY